MFSRLLIYFLKKPQVAKVIREIARPPGEPLNLQTSLDDFEQLLARVLEQRKRRGYPTSLK